MIRAILVVLLTIGVAGAGPITEPDPEMVSIPRAVLLKLIQDYKEQKAANILLWEKDEATRQMLRNWQMGTNCT